MNLRKGVVGLAASTAVVVGLTAGLAFADESYKPTMLGNPDYTNYIDVRNGIYVDGMTYVGPMSAQNADMLTETAALPLQMGAQQDDAYALRVINKLDQAVTKLSLMATDEAAPVDLGLPSDLAAGDAACWWYVQEYRDQPVTNRSGMEYVTPVNYLVQATLADGSVVEFHDVNLKGVLTLALCHSDAYGIDYVERTTLTNHTPDPTLLYEYNRVRGYADDSPETYTPEEFSYHVNSAVRMDDRQITESRGGGWDANVPLWSEVSYAPDFGVYVPLYGEPSEGYTDGTYDYLFWNPTLMTWRVSNGDAGTWKQAGEVEGAGEYGTDTTNEVDYHPGMAEGDWVYSAGE